MKMGDLGKGSRVSRSRNECRCARGGERKAAKGRSGLRYLAVAYFLFSFEAGAENFSRIEKIEYHDDPRNWVLGQVAKRSINDIEIERMSYDKKTALALQAWSFGRLVQTLTHHSDGTISTVKDGAGNVTALSGWKRGVPQSIRYADGTKKSAMVNDHGWVTRVTDENGYVTNYSYDQMGRLARTDYPIGDSTSWNATTQEFVQVNAAEYGIPAGHWRQTVRTGAAVKTTYFDALWRPLLIREYDSGRVASTQRFTGYEYDHAGRVVFSSYPSSSSNHDKGTWTSYDPLGRVNSVAQDSELGLLRTTTSYLSNKAGAYTLVTKPGGRQTRTWYQMFDLPAYDAPVKITQPEGAVTTIARDVFGKPLSIERKDVKGKIKAVKTYRYNARQELCRAVEPETGATLMGYDAAGNLAWSASGLAANTACHSTGLIAFIQPRRVARAYDARNRLTTLAFPDGRGNQAWAYMPDGMPASLTASNGDGHEVTTRYSYNRRRQLTEERMLWNKISWPISYAYNANGHLSSERYPNGHTVNYAPNALGQATQAGNYARAVSYHPNGALKQFTYGNGLIHTVTQNLRQLPHRKVDCIATGCSTVADKRLDLSYTYDKNANVSAIVDNIGGRRNTYLAYDGLDRLVSASSRMFGKALYSYDALDNLTRVSVAAGTAFRDHFYCYDAKWLLTNVKTGSCGGASVIGLGYDVQGNLVNKNGRRFNFDYGNRLRSVNGVASYVYDALGRRVRDYTTGSKYSLYSRDGRLMHVSDVRLGTETQYIYLGGTLIAHREAVGTAVTLKYQHTDALGSVIAVTDTDKKLLETTEFEPFGHVVNRTPKDGPGFTGHVLDAATGMSYMQQRYYDPQVGRFLSVDPVTAFNDPAGAFNRYWYASNNPYRLKDPDGRWPCEAAATRCQPILSDGVRSVGPVGEIFSPGGTGDASAMNEPSPRRITSVDALNHYRKGTGTPLRMNFSDIDTSTVRVVDFPQVRALVSGESVGEFSVDSRIPFSTSGDQAGYLGNITLRLQGRLALEQNFFGFRGTLKSFDDRYDFNRSTHRGILGEILTRWGASQPGVPYDIQIRGSKVVDEVGGR